MARERVSEQSSKSFLIYETLKMRKKVHQVKEKLQEFSKENGKDDNDELKNFEARFNRLQLEQDTRSLETAQLESRAAEEAKDEEAAKNELIIGQQAKDADVLKLQEIMTCGKLYPNNEANNVAYLVETARSVAHHAEQVGRPEDGSSREKAEAPAEVAASVGISERGRWCRSRKVPAEVVAGAPSVEVAADGCLLTQRGAAEYSRTAAANIPTEAERKLHRLVQRKLRAWTRRLRAWTWPGCVRRRGWDPSQKVAGPDEGHVDSMRL